MVAVQVLRALLGWGGWVLTRMADGADGDEDVAVAVVAGGGEGAAAGEGHLGAVGPAVVEVEAEEFGDVVVVGWRATWAGVPCWAMRPPSMTTSWSASTSASTGSWVTSRLGPVKSARWRFEFGLDVEAGAGVQRGQRLVQEQQGGLPGQGAGQGDPLGLPAGQLGGFAAGQVGQPEPGQPDGGGGPGGVPALAADAGGEGHVLGHGEVGEEPVVLEDEPDRPAGGLHERAGLRVVQDLPGQGDPAGGDGGQAGDGAEQGGFPGAVGAEQPEDLPGRRGEGDGQGEPAPADLRIHDQATAAGRCSRLGHTAEPPRSQ